MLSVKSVLAGRGAVDYYLHQTRNGLADYYLPQPKHHDDDAPTLTASGSSWWGGGASTLGLSGVVEQREFLPLYTEAARPDGGYLGRRFRLPAEAAATKQAALREAADIVDPYDRWMAKHEIRRRGVRASVAAWDCTFSPVKSVSLLWAAGDPRIQAQVWAAHLTAVDAGLGYLEEHAAYVRAGRNGVRVLDTTGLVVARMNEWTSRSGDMQLHTHCLILNRAQTLADGKWRALDGRALLAARTGAGALYNRVLEAELTRRLGVAWRDRADGLRELAGVDDQLIEAFSTRRRAITGQLASMVDAYRDKYGIEPPPAVVSAMAQHATLATRPGKRDVDPADALATWEATARNRGRRLADLPRRVLGRTLLGGGGDGAGDRADDVAAVAQRLADDGLATFTRHHLLRAALDVLPPGDATTGELRAAAERLVDELVASRELLGVTAADPIDAPAELRRRDGTSVYDQPQRQRWTLRATLDQEAWLLDVAAEPASPPIGDTVLDAVTAGHQLGDDQTEAVRQLLGSDRRIGLLVGPAGAGKTRTLRAVVDAWHHTGRQVVGLTVSQAAADVLAGEAHLRADNVAKWLHESRRGRWQLPDGALVIVDEASMVATDDLVEIVDQVRRAGGRLLLVGDPAQLAAIRGGGAFDLLADRHGATHLHEIRRFTEPWEADASRHLRDRNPAALAEYAMRSRLHGGTRDDIETRLFDAWRADTLGHEERRRSVLMLVATNEQAAVLSERARHTLLAAGIVHEGPTVRLRDNVASVGDHVVTRRNDRRLATTGDGWVVNGDLWTVLRVRPDGAADVVRHADRATCTLRADYLARHTHLGYATTVHRAQGVTVDVCHAAIAADTSHAQLYVAATRGRHANYLWVTLDTDHDLVADPDDLPTPEHVLTRILQRPDADRHAAHETLAGSLDDVGSLARLGAIFEDAARTATRDWLARLLVDRGVAAATTDPQWAALIDRARQAALAGHDLLALVDQTLRMGPLDDASSTAAVLHWRLDQLATTIPPSRTRGPIASLPPGDGPDIDVARQAGELMRRRWRQLRATLATTPTAPPWAKPLGPRPADPTDAATWLTAATTVTAYRERYELPDYTPMLGPRPSDLRPEAQAAWDHARAEADRHLARRLHHLDDRELDQLGVRLLSLLKGPPRFDPAELAEARRSLERTNRRSQGTPAQRSHGADQLSLAQRAVRRLERQAVAHQAWRASAAEAAAARRQIALERRTRASSSTRAVTRRPMSR